MSVMMCVFVSRKRKAESAAQGARDLPAVGCEKFLENYCTFSLNIKTYMLL